MEYRDNLRGELAYRSAVPESLFDVRFQPDAALSRLLSETEAALRQWNERAQAMSPAERQALIHREAEISWMLADGQTIGLFAPLWVPPAHDAADREDIAHLERATRWAAEMMDELPISRRLLSDAHYLMCQGPRYEKKYPGEFRTSPLWIGDKGRRLQDEDVYVPPVDDDMLGAFSDLERFIHYADDVHPLVRVALAHYQFQAIHPFIDANGRMGRLLSQLQLMDCGLLSAPLLQLSEQLSRHSINYYYLIQQTHLTADYREWVRFFLMCLRKAAEFTISLATVV